MARVLLVDDDEDSVWLIAIVLQADLPLKLVGKAVDGESAVAMVRQHRPDVVLMDLMMPGFDGLEATRRIKEQWPETKILVLTSLTENDFREVAYDSGADGFLNKLDIASRLLLAIRAVTSALRRVRRIPFRTLGVGPYQTFSNPRVHFNRLVLACSAPKMWSRGRRMIARPVPDLAP